MILAPAIIRRAASSPGARYMDIHQTSPARCVTVRQLPPLCSDRLFPFDPVSTQWWDGGAGLRVFIVTSSSALIGWIAMVLSKSALVAPICTATAKPCIISSTLSPIRWIPTYVASSPLQTSFIAVVTPCPDSAWRIGVKSVWYTVTLCCRSRAWRSVRPTVATGGWRTPRWDVAVVDPAVRLSSNRRAARRRPAAIATGVSGVRP